MCSKYITNHSQNKRKDITSWTRMFKWATFREILLASLGDDGRSISQNVAHLNIVVHDVINLLYYEYWTDKQIWNGRTENASKHRKMVAFERNCSWKWLQGCFSHFLLLWLWCQRFLGSSEDRYRSKRLSHMLLVCYSLLNIQNISINNSE